ncbi:ribonuclease inhibitor [Ctenopharyngodon idella]|uniref:ribonuclease inhibitor n=1 Tax=Ctenopharyngodon idella TaxID=7959 RepID=UPI002232BE42|nr:ribonuclease inhibitor [Ctenopharyngodon idella]
MSDTSKDLPFAEFKGDSDSEHRLSGCRLTEESCDLLSRALSSEASCVKELNLSENPLKDAGVKFISKGLQNPHCKLEILRLKNCEITDQGCAHLTSVLKSNSSQLRELDLSENKLGDSGLRLLCDALQRHHCKLENLTLNDCGVTDKGCAALASVMKSNLSQLKYLDLSENQLGQTQVTFLSDGLKNPHCKLENLRLRFCGLLTDESCDVLASALNSNPHLKMLDLTGNKLGDSKIELFLAILKNPHSKLESLWLIDCGLTDQDCADLTLALSSDNSCLRELNLSKNTFGDSGIKHLSNVKNPHSKLESLWLIDCDITDEGCSALASALTSNLSHLKILYMCDKKLGNAGVEHLSVALKNPVCELETLGIHKWTAV